MFEFRMSDLGISGYRCYDMVNARFERNDKGYAGSEEVISIRCGEDVVAECQILAGGVYRGGVLVERGVHFGDAEVVWRPVDSGYGGVWEDLPDFFRVRKC